MVDLDGDIKLLRAVRWLFLRFPLLILVINGVARLQEGKTGRGVIDLVIAVLLLAIDLLLVGRAIRKKKKQLKDPDFREKQRNMSPSEQYRKTGRFTIKFGIGWIIVCLILFIVLPIVFLVDTLGDILFCVIGGLIIAAVGVLFIMLGIRDLKKAGEDDEALPSGGSHGRETLYKDFELGFEPAKEQYCRQTGKTAEELTEADEEIIWEYAYAQITYLLAWIAEHDFYVPQEDDFDGLTEIIADVKARKKAPSYYIGANDGTLFEDNIKPEAIGFVKEYMNNSDYINGHEVAKPGDIIGAYYPEVEAFAKEHLHAEMFGFPFRWEDYDCFKENIDNAYAKWLADSGKITKGEVLD